MTDTPPNDLTTALRTLLARRKESVMLCAGFCIGLSARDGGVLSQHDRVMLKLVGEHLKALGDYLYATRQLQTKDTNE